MPPILYILMLTSCIMFTMQTIFLKRMTIPSFRDNILVIGTFTAVIAVALLPYILLTGETIGTATLLTGLAFGVVFIITLASYYFAMQTGPLSYTSFFFSASMVIPAVLGILIWGDPFSMPVVFGGLLFVVAFFFISVLGGEKGKKANPRWLLLCLIAWAANGGLSLIVKTQQTLLDGKEYFAMMFVSFAAAGVFSYMFYAVSRLKSKSSGASAPVGDQVVKHDFALLLHYWLPILIIGIGTGVGNLCVAYLSSRVPLAYLFPLVLGGNMVVVTLYSIVVGKEKINRLGIVGLFISLSAMVVINL